MYLWFQEYIGRSIDFGFFVSQTIVVRKIQSQASKIEHLRKPKICLMRIINGNTMFRMNFCFFFCYCWRLTLNIIIIETNIFGYHCFIHLWTKHVVLHVKFLFFLIHILYAAHSIYWPMSDCLMFSFSSLQNESINRQINHISQSSAVFSPHLINMNHLMKEKEKKCKRSVKWWNVSIAKYFIGNHFPNGNFSINFSPKRKKKWFCCKVNSSVSHCKNWLELGIFFVFFWLWKWSEVHWLQLREPKIKQRRKKKRESKPI